jgi:putative acetyltransferase
MRRLAASIFQLGALPLQTAVSGSHFALQGKHFGHGQIWVARASDCAPSAAPPTRPAPSVRIESLGQAEVQALLANLDREQDRLRLSKQSPHHQAVAALRRSPMRLGVVRDAQMRVVACGALLLHEEYAELAQLFVAPAQRGQGLGQLLLAKLEAEAIQARRPLLRMAADVRQHTVQRLCERSGFRRCGPFAGRRADPFSVYMESLLGRR